MATIADYRNEQINKLNELRDLGISPYPAKSFRDIEISKISDNYSDFESKTVTVAGRILSVRTHGKLNFIDIADENGQLQLLLRAENLEADFDNSELSENEIRLLTRGDFVESRGKVTKSKTGEISVESENLRILTKSIRPLPNDLTDKEARLRRRYLDMAINPEVRNRFKRRSNFWRATRDYLNENGFTEVNTPVLEHTTGGADANPFATHMDALDEDFYLRISHELPLKRLLGAGFEKVYDIGPRFRNENYTEEHLPEHIAMEFYWAYCDWEKGMQFMEDLMKHTLESTFGKLKFNVRGFEVDLDKTWERWDYGETIKSHYNLDIYECSIKDVKQALKDNNLEVEDSDNKARGIDKLWKNIRKDVAGPVWLINTPLFISPLSKKNQDDPRTTQRFQPVIAGSELGNNFGELNDPQDQYQRFLEQQQMREAGDNEAMMMDVDFVEMLEYGMPPACGFSYSERLFWVFEGVTAREGVPFPQLRAEVSESTKNIYTEVYGTEGILAKSGEREQDTGKRIIAIVDKNLENWQVANATAHMSAYHGNKMDEKVFQSGKYFVTKDGAQLPRNSQHPIMIKRADQKELHKLLSKVSKSNLRYHVFIKEMIDTNLDLEIVEKLKLTDSNELNIYGIAIFGDNEEVNKFTKHYQLWN